MLKKIINSREACYNWSKFKNQRDNNWLMNLFKKISS